jgi:hypothetical protein
LERRRAAVPWVALHGTSSDGVVEDPWRDREFSKYIIIVTDVVD